MQRLLLVILSSFFLFQGCKKSLPEGILPKRTMVDLMTEVHLVDGYLNTLPLDSTRRVVESLYAEVFRKFKVDSTQFKQNVAYYLGDPVLSKELYVTINKKLMDYDNAYRVADSVRNAKIADSVRVVQRFIKLKDAAHKLILQVQKDTIPLTPTLYRTEFMDRVGLYLNVYDPSKMSPQPGPSSPLVMPATPPGGSAARTADEHPKPTRPPLRLEEQVSPVEEKEPSAQH
ncbi:uncharacterized protein DUF4296 [Sphingobacterium allocomposti]|uniref:Uncharacterized protein DUF4296 n=1 Tax=Sphingobacterium allocomposti TaxID=415956 RepID=A0A5S5DKS3_9SPHI|nr:DUF4296 domain-containing protein [Sphingobacterium composti Yoo et al. 2007 non Ten et al. 2007]TYP96517.1 uncharacterized protein DUF4296 [Sphingobacterium composti Yoo et al. 2007 non Ten et al. 2007]HLS94638.1 DUF4296 domain-containing protein [Sphingobacterium sp.]